MYPLYIDERVSNIHVHQYRLCVSNPYLRKHLYQFDYGNFNYDALIVQNAKGAITFDALRFLDYHACSFSVLNRDGTILYQFTPASTINPELRLAQYDAYKSKETHFFIVKELVETKTRRQKDLLQQLSPYYKIHIPNVASIRNTSQDFIRNIEAQYAVKYFEQFGKMCNQLGYSFKLRRSQHTNRHAKDLPNALLNYGYACLETYVRRAISSVGLDNSVSFLHYLTKGTSSLTFDIMEIYRPVIDYCVILTLEHLRKHKMTKPYIIKTYETRITQETICILYDYIRLNLQLIDIINQTRALAKYMMHETSTLTFNPLPIHVKRKVSPITKQLILNHTARQLGMNKSTHWYMKKRLQRTGILNQYNTTRYHFTKENIKVRDFAIELGLYKNKHDAHGHYDDWKNVKIEQLL